MAEASKNRSLAGSLFIALGVLSLAIGVWSLMSGAPDDPVGRLALPAIVYGPVLIAVAVVMVGIGIYLRNTSPK